MTKYFIAVKLALCKRKQYIGMKNNKIIIRSNRKSKFSLSYDTLEEADKFIVENQNHFIERSYFETVSVQFFNT